jgi:hypothetical protein
VIEPIGVLLKKVEISLVIELRLYFFTFEDVRYGQPYIIIEIREVLVIVE